ncbi:MAG: haloacid dehalogenase-like hydrolase [Oscillospiraceae bacterium]|nr:haloacid dehalogenase-like hydrolase [Oscillospiraceae bacterium]
MKKSKIWKVTAITAIALLIVVSVLYAVSLSKPKTTSANDEASVTASQTTVTEASQTEAQTETPTDAKRTPEEILAHWTDSSQTKTQLSAYLKNVTDELSADFIPEKDRIAVFDLDGTILSETNPVYFDHLLLVYRVFEDPDYKDKASDFEKYTAAKILGWIQDGTYPENMDVDHGTAIATAFAGMTVEEFEAYVAEFGSQPAPGYNGMTRAQSLYQPMLEILDVLDEYGFSSYIVSGTDRLIVRGGLEETLGIPMNRIIGSDETLVASGQNGENGLKYQFTKDDKLVTGGEFIIKNLKMNKVSVIAKEIGIHPVLSFGNTTGDQSMADYTLTNSRYKSMAFMLCCDDTDREYGNIEKADKMYGLCNEHGWVPVSMQNDWTTIYGDGVTKAPESLEHYTELYEQYKYLLEKTDIPEYEYPGPELFYTVLYDYIENFKENYEESDVSIPCPVIIYEDETDREDIKVYGDFWLFNYDLNGDTLENVSGGSYPGCIHIKTTEEGYEVTGFDGVADGSGYTDSAKEIFGEHYDEFISSSEGDTREQIRAQIIANYVAANGLDIRQYQDYGWDPVPLPEQNIDSFYSSLDGDMAA